MSDKLYIGSWQEPDNLNSYFTWTSSGVWFGIMAIESMFRPDGRGGYTPVLAARVPSLGNGDLGSDGRDLTLRLRPDLRWADGMPVTSADLRFTWQVIADPRNEVIGREGFQFVQAVDTPDDRTAVLRFSEPYAAYPMLYMSVYPKHLFGHETVLNRAPFNRAPMGTGPYFVTGWEPGRQLTYQRNPYFRGPGPFFDEVILRFYPSQDALADAFLGGEVDLAISLALHHIGPIRARTDLQVVHLPSTQIERIMFNLRDSILAHPQVRLAIDLAIDREELSREASNGILAPAVSELDGSDWFTPFSARHADLARAGELLDKAGWRPGSDRIRTKDGQTLRLSLVAPEGDSLRARVITVLVRMLRAVGIKLDVRWLPTRQYFAMVSEQGPLVEGRFQMALSNGGMFGDPEPNYTEQFDSALIPGPQNNYVGGNWGAYHNSDVDDMLRQARTTLNREERTAIYHALERRIHDDCPVSYLYKRPIIDAWRADLAGLQHLPYVSVWSLTWSAADWRRVPIPVAALGR